MKVHEVFSFKDLYLRVIGISGSLIWSKTLMVRYLTPVVNFGGPEDPVSQIHSPHLIVCAPGIFSDLLRFVQMLKKESGVRKATGSYCAYSFLVKLQPRFLSLPWKTCLWAELQPWCLSLQWRTCPWAEHWRWCWSIFAATALGRCRVASSKRRHLYPREGNGTYFTGGWAGPRASVDKEVK